MRKTALVALLVLIALPGAADAQAEADADTLTQQVRAAAHWPHAAQQARDAGVPSDEIAALFEFVREQDYLSRDVRRLVLAIAARASDWGSNHIVAEARTALESGVSPTEVRDRLLAEPVPEQPGGDWEPRSGSGPGDGTGRAGGQGRWEPGSGSGPGSGAGIAVPEQERDWAVRSGNGPRDRSGVGSGSGDSE